MGSGRVPSPEQAYLSPTIIPLTHFSSHSLALGDSHFQTRYGQSVCARQAGGVVAGVGSFTFDILQLKVSPSCPWGGLGPIQWRGTHLGSLGRGAVLSQAGVWVSPDGTGPETWRLVPEAQDGAEATSPTEESLERSCALPRREYWEG